MGDFVNACRAEFWLKKQKTIDRRKSYNVDSKQTFTIVTKAAQNAELNAFLVCRQKQF